MRFIAQQYYVLFGALGSPVMLGKGCEQWMMWAAYHVPLAGIST